MSYEHHAKCPKVQAWDIEGVPCDCPPGWPRKTLSVSPSPSEPKPVPAPYGVECGSGWKGLYAPLLTLCDVMGITVLQVKEKFGTLRFYIQGERARELAPLIAAAEVASGHICEHCGEDGFDYIPSLSQHIPRATKGAISGSRKWIKTLCTACREIEAQR